MEAYRQIWCWRSSWKCYILQAMGSQLRNWAVVSTSLETSKTAWTVTHFPQESHTYSNKVTPPNIDTSYEIMAANYIQTTIPLQHSEWLRSVNKWQFFLMRMCNKGNTNPLLVGILTCTTTTEISKEVHKRYRKWSTSGSRYTTLRPITKGCFILPESLLIHVYCCSIQWSQKLKTT